MRLVLDFDNWTMGDIERLEEAADMSFHEVLKALQSGTVRFKLAIALAYAAGVRSDPSYTLQEARALKVGELEISTKEEAPLAAPVGA